jgi:hypothetical protein
MKKFILMLFVLLAASQAFAKKEKKKDEKDMKIDSLVKACDSLRVNFDSLNKVNSLRYDSVSTELQHVYIIIKEKILKKDFDIVRLPYMLDSLIAMRDSSFSKYSANSTTLMDSLSSLKKENVRMKSMLDGIVADETAKNRIVYELKQLKELLDSKILYQSEYDALKKGLLEKW